MNKEKIIEINKLLKSLDDDSKKVAQNSRDKLNEIAEEHFQKLYNISNKIGYKYFDRYRGENFIDFQFKQRNILYFLLSSKYSDDADQENVSIEDLSDFDYNKFEEDIKEKRIDAIKRNIESLKIQLLKNEQDLNVLIQ